MTPVFLLEELQKFISSKTSDIILPVRTRTGSSEEKERAAAVYKMGLPEADDVQQKGFMSNALHRTFAVALVARTSHAGFINEFAGTIALAANNNICFHNHSPFFLAGRYAIATSLSAPIFLSRTTPS